MDEQLESPFGLINDHNLDSSNYNLTALDHTKILDTESENLYDSDRKDSFFCGQYKLSVLRFRKAGPGHRATERPYTILYFAEFIMLYTGNPYIIKSGNVFFMHMKIFAHKYF